MKSTEQIAIEAKSMRAETEMGLQDCVRKIKKDDLISDARDASTFEELKSIVIRMITA